MDQIIIVKFEGIDSWYRPIFKDLNSNKRYGSTDKLCRNRLEAQGVTEADLLYFGNSFDCEPFGSIHNNLKIVRG